MENKKSHNVTKKSPYIFLGLIFIFTISVLSYFLFLKGKESTEDAKIVGHIVTIAPRIEGQVVKTFVDNDTPVNEGDVLVQLDDSLQKANVELAQADFDSSQAAFKQATVDITQARASFLAAQSSKELEFKNLERVLSLSKQKAITQQAVDQQKAKYQQAESAFESAKAVLYMSESLSKEFGNALPMNNPEKIFTYAEKMKGRNPALDAAIAKMKKAKATLDLAKLNLSYTLVRAPFSGVVANKTVEIGKNVNPNIPLLSIVSVSNTWVVANLKETQIKRMSKGDSVKIKVDTYKGKVYKGVVESIAPASGDSFALLPPDNASGNFVKVTQRFPVRIRFNPYPKEIMRPGMSVVVTIKEE
jgi:membrane fusion protein (multidrug efflux system)